VTEETSPCHLFCPEVPGGDEIGVAAGKVGDDQLSAAQWCGELDGVQQAAAFKMFSLGIGCVVFTGRRGKNPPLTLTVPVKTRRGSVAS